jgi:DNA polymerase III sliding clamp (beta) subunit (PCNA family)
MKVIVDRSAFLEAVNLVSGAVAARTPKLQLT